MARSLPTTVAPIVKKKEVLILKKGAEGKLLVPDVKLKVSTSYVTISGPPASSYRNSSNGRITRRTSEFSDSSMTSVTEEDELTFKSRGVESEYPSRILFFIPLLILLQHMRGHTTTSSHTPAWHRLSGRRSDSRSEWSTVSNMSSRSRSSYPSRGCSSARKFVRTFLFVHPLRRNLASHRTIIRHIAVFSHPIPSSTL